MYCPVCGLTPELVDIEEHEGYHKVRRHCKFDRVTWSVKVVDKVITEVHQGDNFSDLPGYLYHCTRCGHKAQVNHIFQVHTGFKCVSCGGVLPKEFILASEGFNLDQFYLPVVGKRTRGKRESTPGYTREPRERKPLPDGSVGIREVSENLGIEPKKLRSWLRKSNWRKSDESGMGWQFSPDEVKEIQSNFQK